ncbi:protein kinase [bacterium]|nr:protein kinase [bacterium]
MIGRTVGQYEIQEQLGAGGMGVVYRALDTKLGRTVALKFLPTHLSSDEKSKLRFMQEAKAASALDHANICTIHDIAEDDGGHLFIVMSYYDGQTLKYLLQNEPPSIEEATTIGIQIARGLSRAHEAGIVHRDIKPANIMVTSRKEVKILDFGVAKLSEGADLTKEGSTIGTAFYMSPEQSKGESVDVRADVWSLGIVLFEMLTGRLPFEGGYEAALVYAIINEEAPPVHSINPKVPEALSDVVARCLAKQPDQRYSSAKALVSDLELFDSPSGTRTSITVEKNTPLVPSSRNVVLRFAPIAGAVIAATWAAVALIGLPNWVLPLCVVLMLMGLPALLMAANQDRRRSEGRDLGGPFEWLTLRKAQWGGVYAMSALILMTVSFMGMRELGLGPWGSLQASGALKEDASILVADFDNSTSEEALSESVTELLRIALSQSSAIRLLESSDISSALIRMERDPNTRVDIDTGMEIAQREGVEGVVWGKISPIGSGYLLTASMFAVHDGSELVKLSQTAHSADDIIDAVDRLSKDLRERIGESIKSIRSNEDLDRVTTASLDALRLYTQGVEAEQNGNVARSIEFLNQAIERDSTFAMAYRKLAVVNSNASGGFDVTLAAAKKAYEYRNRLPELERLLTEAYFYSITGEYQKTVSAYESLLDRYPNNTAALNNVSLRYQIMGRFEDAERVLVKALELGNRSVYYQNYFATLTALKKWDKAKEILNQYDAVYPNHPMTSSMRFHLAMLTGQLRGSDSLLTLSEANSAPIWQAYENRLNYVWSAKSGRIGASKSYVRESAKMELERNEPSQALFAYIQAAIETSVIMDDTALTEELLEEGLRLAPFDSIAPESRPYTELSFLYSKLGNQTKAQELLDRFERELAPEVKKGNWAVYPARAAIQEANGNSQDAIETIRAGRKELGCDFCFFEIEGELLSKIDSTSQAIRLFEKLQDWTWGYSQESFGSIQPVVWLNMGELYSRNGQLNEAVEAYSNFIDLWAEADPSLQPKVRYARNRVERLLDQLAREPQ